MNTNTKIKDITYISLFAALICVSAYIVIPLPFSPVELTMQTLIIMLTGCILTPRQAAFSVLIYLLIGAIGVPVFAGGAAGIGIIVGKKGGYLLGFLIGAVAISFLKGKGTNFIRLFIANAIGGIVIVYFFGVLWLNFVTHIGIVKAFSLGALPFIPLDLLKAGIAAIVGQKLNKIMGYNN